MIEKIRVRLKVCGDVRRQNDRDGTKPRKWFKLKLEAEASDLDEKKEKFGGASGDSDQVQISVSQ